MLTLIQLLAIRVAINYFCQKVTNVQCAPALVGMSLAAVKSRYGLKSGAHNGDNQVYTLNVKKML